MHEDLILTQKKIIKKASYKLQPLRIFREVEIEEAYQKFVKLANQKGTAIYKAVDQLFEKHDSLMDSSTN
jgi:hypothetical protein